MQSSFPWKKWEVGFRCAIRSYIPREGWGGGGTILHIALTLPPTRKGYIPYSGEVSKLLRISRFCGYSRNFSLDMAFFGGTSKQFTKVFFLFFDNSQKFSPVKVSHYMVTCYLGNLTVEERYEQHSHMFPR